MNGYLSVIMASSPKRSEVAAGPPTLMERVRALESLANEAEASVEKERFLYRLRSSAPYRALRYIIFAPPLGFALAVSAYFVLPEDSKATDDIVAILALVPILGGVTFLFSLTILRALRAASVATRPVPTRAPGNDGGYRTASEEELLRRSIASLERRVHELWAKQCDLERATRLDFWRPTGSWWARLSSESIAAPSVPFREASDRMRGELTKERATVEAWLLQHWMVPAFQSSATLNALAEAVIVPGDVPTLIARTEVRDGVSALQIVEVFVASPGAPDRKLAQFDAARADLANWTIAVRGAGIWLCKQPAYDLTADAIVRACMIARQIAANADRLVAAAS